MKPVCSVETIRAAEEAFFAAHPGVDLMQIAASRVADEARAMIQESSRRVLVVVGGGNNGGDGLFAARELAQSGARVTLWLVHGRGHDAGLAAARHAGCECVDAVQALHSLPDVDLVIDAVFGIGGRPGLSDEVATFAHAARDLGVRVLSVDLPSGLDADSPAATESLWAERTLTFGALKFCQVARPAAERCGKVVVADIGLECVSTVHAMTWEKLASSWPWPQVSDDKYSRGVVGIDTGSRRYPGAALLSCLGAVYSGAGLVRFIGPERATDLTLARTPSITTGSGRTNVWLIGSGWGDSEDNQERVQRAANQQVPLVIDADALRHLPDRLPDNSLLTPHAGELARLLDVARAEVETDPLVHARAAARRHGVSVLLKGATTYSVSADGETIVALPGPAWSAQAGSGDVLAGICATLLAAGLEASLAGACAASIQALAADRLGGPYPPDRLAEAVPAVVGDMASEMGKSPGEQASGGVGAELDSLPVKLD